MQHNYSKQVFVFGSNLAGIHGAGAAKYALQHHGAIWGQGIGLAGNSYALPTKDENIQTLSSTQVMNHIAEFLDFAKANPTMLFHLTPVGCGLAGFKPEQIKVMLKHHGIPDNVVLTRQWFTDY